MTRVETQLGRMVSDMESEKRTRAVVNADHEARLRSIERTLWAIGGGLALLEIGLRVLTGH